MTACPVCQFSFDAAKVPDGLCPRCLLMGGVDDGEVGTTLASEGPWVPPSVKQVQAMLPGYVVEEMIGRGGMGAVYRARQPELDRVVAVKVAPGRDDSGLGVARRFKNEARVLGRLQHPNIMPVHELGTDEDGQSFYTMKLVKGRTLQAILNDLRDAEPETVRRFPLAALLTIFDKVCDALAFAHAEGVLHRDLKPENIMVGEFGEVLVLDWGLAKRMADEVDVAHEHASFIGGFDLALAMTLDGDVMGTPQYMSPEQAEGRVSELDERSDVFALGGVLYAILTLHPPVEGETVAAVLKQVREGAITPPALHATTAARRSKARQKQEITLQHCPAGRVPEALSAVAMKALRHERGQRYPSVVALQADVGAYVRGFATSAEEASAVRLLQLFVLRHKGVSAALLALVLFTAGFVMKLVQSERAERAARVEARRALARSQVSLAEAALREKDSGAMLTALDSVPEDLRDTDWRYLHAAADNSHRVFPGISLARAHPWMPGVFVAVRYSTGSVLFLRAATGETVRELPGLGTRCVALEVMDQGRRLAVLGLDASLICDAESGEVLTRLAHGNVMPRVSQDGSRLLVGAPQHPWNLFDSEGRLLWSVPQARVADFLPSGDVLMFQPGKITILRAADGQVMKELAVPAQALASVLPSPDGKTVYFGEAGLCRGISLVNGAVTFEKSLTETQGPVWLALSGDGRRLLTSVILPGEGCDARLWDVVSGTALKVLMGGTRQARNVVIHPLSGELILGHDNRETRVWLSGPRAAEASVTGAKRSGVFWGAEDVIISVHVPLQRSADGRWLPMPGLPPDLELGSFTDAAGETAVFGQFRNATLSGSPVNLGAGEVVTLRRGAEGVTLLGRGRSKKQIQFVCLSPGGVRVAVSQVGLVEILDALSGGTLCECDLTGFVAARDLAWLSDEEIVGISMKQAPSGSAETQELTVWDARTGRVLRRMPGMSRMLALSISPDGRTLAEGGDDKRIRLRDAATLEVLHTFRAHDGPITALAWHPLKRMLATASGDGSVKLWNLPEGTLVEELRPSSHECIRLAFSPEGTRLACSGARGPVHLYPIAGPAPER